MVGTCVWLVHSNLSDLASQLQQIAAVVRQLNLLALLIKIQAYLDLALAQFSEDEATLELRKFWQNFA